MRFNSLCQPLGSIVLPGGGAAAQVYMQPHVIGERVSLPTAEEFAPTVENMLARLDERVRGKVFITIDRRLVKAGGSHRRPGAHVDGNFIFDWQGGGGGWLTGVEGRILSPENHRLQYCNPNGGLLIASNHQACRTWHGQFDGMPNQGGDCSHLQHELDTAESFLMEPNQVYLGNSTCVHESLPLDQDVFRTLVRITLPADHQVLC